MKLTKSERDLLDYMFEHLWDQMTHYPYEWDAEEIDASGTLYAKLKEL